MRSHPVAFGLTLVVPAILAAQVPKITPSGDPTVKSDTIYRLAVDPAKHPERSTAVLLDDGVVSVTADGRTTKTYRMVVQLLKPDAEESYQEQSFSYAPGHQRMTINWIRVVRPNGEVVSAAPSHVQDSDVPADEGDPVYSDQKVRRASLTGVKAGTIVDWSYTIEELKPFLPGDFFLTWSINPGSPVLRSRYIVDVPTSLQARIIEKNLSFPRKTQDVGGRRIYTWAAADLPAVRPEALAADSNGVYMTVTIASPLTWADIGRWYAGNAKGRYTLTPELERKVIELVRDAKTRADTIRAIHRWVAQDIRYVSIALGLGGYQPRTPEETMRTAFGDCKDKATLFVAALARLGIPAFPVLLDSDGAADRRLPSIAQFDHVIAAVKVGDRYQYTDLTAELVPYGEIPFSYQGGFGVLVRGDGSSEEVEFPRIGLEDNVSSVVLSGTLAESGHFSGVYVEEVTGPRASALRDVFRHPLDSATRVNGANNVARKYFDGAEGDSLQGFNGLDLSAKPGLRVRIRNGRAADAAGNSMILKLPLGNMRPMLDAARELEAEPPRKFPIDPQKFWGYGVNKAEFRVTLPKGWKAQLPKGVTATSAFGSYQSEYTQVGDQLIARRITKGATGIQPPDSVKDFIAWLRAIGADDAVMIVLDKGSVTQAGKP
jgi:hypothetical protein